MRAFTTTLLTAVLTTQVHAGLVYNNNMECGYPFAALTIEQMQCYPDSFYTFGDYNNNNNNNQAQNYQDAQENNQYYEEPGSCLAGEIMDVSGSLTIENERVTKYFEVTLKMCWTKWNMNYKCITHKETVDLGYYALTEEQQQENQEAEEEQEGEQEEQENQNQNQNGQGNKNNMYDWYNPYKGKYNLDSMYLYPGTYDYTIRLTIPDNSYTQSDTPANLYITFKPEESYKHTIFRQRAWYSKVKDYSQKTKCYSSFNGDYEEYEEDEQAEGEQQQQQGDYYYWNYQQQAGVAGVSLFLMGAAAALRRRQVAARDDDAVDQQHDYEQHVDGLTKL